jgi:hypothetical protein
MILDQYKPSERDTWQWQQPTLNDVDAIVQMAIAQFQCEIDSVFTPSPDLLAKNLAVAIVRQRFTPLEEQIIVARETVSGSDQLAAWSWMVRGCYMTYAPEECAEARFAHIDQTLSIRSRVTLMAQILQQWELWAVLTGCPVIVSSTIRGDQQGFLRIHKEAGYQVRGSIGYKKIKEIK